MHHSPNPNTPPPPASPSPGGFAAAQLGQIDWQLEVEPPEAVEPEFPAPAPAAPPPVPSRRIAPPESDTPPPPPERILEAMLFLGGPPLLPKTVASAIRGFDSENIRDAVDRLNKTYRSQNRPYSIVTKEGGFVLAVKPQYRAVKERLLGGPREARLSQPALDVLSLVAYRQPISKGDIDSLRGTDSAGMLRQLVRLGIIAVSRRADAEGRTVCYGTTPRFLELFHLASLDDLPRLGDPQRV